MTSLDLNAIETRAAHLDEYALLTDEPLQADLDQLTHVDVPAMAAEIRRLRGELTTAVKRDITAPLALIAKHGEMAESVRREINDLLDDAATERNTVTPA